MAQESKYFWKQDRWNGGLSEDSRIAAWAGGFRFGIGCDIRTDSGLLKVAKKPVLHNNIEVGEIDWFEIDPVTRAVYMYGQNKIYKEQDGNTTVLRTLTADSPNGQGLRDFDGFLYYRTATNLGRLNYETGEFDDDWQQGLSSCVHWSPMEVVKNVLLVGHGRYIGTVDDVGFWTPQRLVLPPDYNVRDIFRAGSFAVILATKGTNITDSEDGLMFLWDTTSQNYNDYIPLDGNPHAGIAHKNKIVVFAGQQTTIQESLGGMTEIVQSIPNIEDGDTAEIYPGAVDIWRNMVHFGISDGTSETVIRALYNWGAKNSKFPSVLNAEFPTSVFDASGLSADLYGTGIKITACKKIGTTLRFAFKSGNTYGICQIDTTQYQNQAVWRSLAFDRESPYIKTPDKLLTELAGSLAINESVIVKISPDPYGDPAFSNTDDVNTITEDDLGSKVIELPIVTSSKPIRSRDMHVELRLKGTGATRPSVKRTWVEILEDSDQL